MAIALGPFHRGLRVLAAPWLFEMDVVEGLRALAQVSNMLAAKHHPLNF